MKPQQTCLDEEQYELYQIERLLDSPMGRVLYKQGATFRRWRNTTPSNLWIENKRGKMLFHSSEEFDCPVRQAYALLMRTNGLVEPDDNGPGWSGEEVYRLSDALRAKAQERQLLRKTAPAGAKARGPRL